jgi:hypothetical protein
VLNCASPSSHQIDDDHDQSQYQKQVDEASSNAQAKPKKPQNQEHNDERPKHNFLLCAAGKASVLCAPLQVLVAARATPWLPRSELIRFHATPFGARSASSHSEIEIEMRRT